MHMVNRSVEPWIGQREARHGKRERAKVVPSSKLTRFVSFQVPAGAAIATLRQVIATRGPLGSARSPSTSRRATSARRFGEPLRSPSPHRPARGARAPLRPARGGSDNRGLSLPSSSCRRTPGPSSPMARMRRRQGHLRTGKISHCLTYARLCIHCSRDVPVGSCQGPRQPQEAPRRLCRRSLRLRGSKRLDS